VKTTRSQPPRHFLSLWDLTSDQFATILTLARELKRRARRGQRPPLLERRVLAMLFEKPSLRTRVSFEAAMAQAGGQALFLTADVGWREREPIEDFVPVLSRYVDAIVLRTMRHDTLLRAAELSRVPVINGLSDEEHPCQALADLLTIDEAAGGLSGVRVAYVGDANNVARSLAHGAALTGIELAIASPREYQFTDQSLAEFNDRAGRTCVRQYHDIAAAVAGAAVVYTDVWTSMGQESEQASRRAAFADFQVDRRAMARAAPGAVFLHCLPARRGEEVAAEVIDGPHSRVVDQAENRLHAQKALLVWLLADANAEVLNDAAS